jgi:hypothetical protein
MGNYQSTLTAMNSTIITEGQSLVDVALQEGGSLSQLFALADANGLGITDTLEPGQVLELPAGLVARPDITSYYARQSYRVNTGDVPAGGPLPHPADYNTDYTTDYLIGQ